MALYKFRIIIIIIIINPHNKLIKHRSYLLRLLQRSARKRGGLTSASPHGVMRGTSATSTVNVATQ